jgi:hypothetical protein
MEWLISIVRSLPESSQLNDIWCCRGLNPRNDLQEDPFGRLIKPGPAHSPIEWLEPVVGMIQRI